MHRGVVFNIQHYSVHDGDGIRTIVFLKGCPLDCIWCSNPEGKKTAPQLAYNPSKCIGDKCKICKKNCKDDFITWSESLQLPVINFRKNNPENLRYAKLCPAKAMTVYGKEMTADEVIAEVEKDHVFYSRSGGGVTFSGGEPLLQSEFLMECLTICANRGLRTCIETTVYAPWENVEKVFDKLDSAYIDIKHINPLKHKKYTGVDNEVILNNLKKIGEKYKNKPIRIRTPIIPQFNDTKEEVLAIREFIDTYLSNAEYEILKYHKFGNNKYDYIGEKILMPEDFSIEEGHFNMLKKLVNSF